VPPSDSAALAHAIIRLAQDFSLRKRLQQRAIDTIRSTYNVTGMTRNIEAIYNKLLAASH